MYTISNTPNNGGATGMARPASDLNSGATHIRIEPDGRGGPPPQYGGYTSQNLIVVTTIPRGACASWIKEGQSVSFCEDLFTSVLLCHYRFAAIVRSGGNEQERSTH